jgi:hypothetical protein
VLRAAKRQVCCTRCDAQVSMYEQVYISLHGIYTMMMSICILFGRCGGHDKWRTIYNTYIHVNMNTGRHQLVMLAHGFERRPSELSCLCCIKGYIVHDHMVSGRVGSHRVCGRHAPPVHLHAGCMYRHTPIPRVSIYSVTSPLMRSRAVLTRAVTWYIPSRHL